MYNISLGILLRHNECKLRMHRFKLRILYAELIQTFKCNYEALATKNWKKALQSKIKETVHS